MGLLDIYGSPCDKTWTGRHTPTCGHILEEENGQNTPDEECVWDPSHQYHSHDDDPNDEQKSEFAHYTKN